MAGAQETVSDASIAAYADAANYQTGGAIDLAIDAWKKFLSKYPDHPKAPEAAHYLGVCYMQREQPDYASAASAFQQALQSQDYPLRQESMINLGWCLYVLAGDGEQRDPKKLQQSLRVFERLLKAYPKTPFKDRALFYSGEASYGLGKLKQAIDFYDQMLALPDVSKSPLRCDALYARAVAYEEWKQHDKALASYRQILDSCKRPELIGEVHIRMGDLLILQKQFDAAIESFDAALVSDTSAEDQSYALFRKAFALVQSGRPGEAAKTYERLLQEFPGSQYASESLLASAQSSYRNGDFEQAAARFRQVLQQKHPSAATEAAHWLAQIEIRGQRYDRAAAIAKSQLDAGAAGPFADDLKMDLAESLSLIPGKANDALPLFEQLYQDARDTPLGPRALYNAAFTALQLGQNERAIKWAKEFASRYPDDTLLPDVQFIEAESLLSEGDHEAAAKRFVELVTSQDSSNPQFPVWLVRTAFACNRAGMYSETINLLTSNANVFDSPALKAEASLLLGYAYLRTNQFRLAAEAFEQSRDADPSGSRAGEAALMAGQAKLQAGDRKGAIQTWKRLISAAPNARMAQQARYKLAQLDTDAGQYSDAIALYDQILNTKADPGLVPYALYGKALALIQLNEYPRALDCLNQLLTQYADHPLRNEGLLARGIAYRNLGKIRDAESDLNQFLATNPTGISLGHALYELALIDQQQKRPDKAAEKLQRLVTEVPDYPATDKVLYELGWSFHQNGDDAAASEAFQTLVSKNPDSDLTSDAAYFIAEQFYDQSRWKEAAKYFELAAQRSQDASQLQKSLYRLGWAQFKAEQYDQAASTFKKLADADAQGQWRFDALMMIGECHFKKSDFASALRAYEQAREHLRAANDRESTVAEADQRRIRALMLLHGGQSAAQLKQWDKAIEWFDELRERFPTSDYLAQVFYETGFAYQQKGDSDKALQFFEQVAENYRNELGARARFMMGEIYFANQQFDKAIPEFQRVMLGYGAEKAPDRIKNWQAKSGFEAGRCSELLMQRARSASARQRAAKYAEDFFRYVIEKHPRHPLVEKSRERLQVLVQ